VIVFGVLATKIFLIFTMSFYQSYAAFTLNGFDNQERNLMFVKTFSKL